MNPQEFARVKAAFMEGYDAMRQQFNLGNFVAEAWEAYRSRLWPGEPMPVNAHSVAELIALADTMRHGLHGNVVDVPVSPKLDEWVEGLDRIIAEMQTPEATR